VVEVRPAAEARQCSSAAGRPGLDGGQASDQRWGVSIPMGLGRVGERAGAVGGWTARRRGSPRSGRRWRWQRWWGRRGARRRRG
jgi:hypothetical protein